MVIVREEARSLCIFVYEPRMPVKLKVKNEIWFFFKTIGYKMKTLFSQQLFYVWR